MPSWFSQWLKGGDGSVALKTHNLMLRFSFHCGLPTVVEPFRRRHCAEAANGRKGLACRLGVITAA
jgi:hypothetical protein